MYSKGHGKSKSRKPFTTAPPTHISEKEVIEIVINLAKKGNSCSEIGKVLRDNYGVGSIYSMTNSTMLELLKQHNLAPKIPDDVISIEKKCISIYNHLKKETGDKNAFYRLKQKESRLHRLIRYYKSKEILPKDFKTAFFKLKKKN